MRECMGKRMVAHLAGHVVYIYILLTTRPPVTVKTTIECTAMSLKWNLIPSDII